jgi:hypothetical protein
MIIDTYSKYLAKLQFGCAQLEILIKALGQASKVSTQEDIDARLKAIDRSISYLQDVRRAILYFKNTLGR